MNPLQTLLAGLTFAVELALFFGVGKAIHLLLKDTSPGLSLAAGIAAALVFVLVWAFFFAPKAEHRLPALPRIILIALFSITTGLGLYALGLQLPGLLLATAGTLVLVLGQLLVSR